MSLIIKEGELPKTLFEVPDFFKLDKVIYHLSDYKNIFGTPEEAILDFGVQLLDLKNEKSELREWFKNEYYLLKENYIIIFINEYLKDIDNFDIKKRVNVFQKVISDIEPEYKLKLRKYKINKIKNGIC